MSLKENLLNIKNKIVSIRDGLAQTLKDKNVDIPDGATLTDVANAVSLINEGGVEITLGQVDEDGKFQALKFDGTTATSDGEPQDVENYYSWNSEK